MADILRIISLSVGGRPVVELDIENYTAGVAKTRDSFKVTPGQKKQRSAQGYGRYQGSQVVGETLDNGSIGATFLVRGSTVAAAQAKLEQFLQSVDETAQGRYVEWRPDGTAQSTLFEIRGPGSFDPNYRWVQFAQAFSLEVQVTWPVAPLALGLPMDVFDDFAVDSTSDYSISTPGHWTIAGGQLVPSGGFVGDRLIHTARGYQVDDVQASAKVTPDGTVSTGKLGVILAYLDANNYLYAEVTSTLLRIYKVDGGVTTQLATSTITGLTASVSRWLRFRKEGNLLTAEFWLTEPRVGTYPSGSDPLLLTFTLTGGDITKFGAGVQGYTGMLLSPNGSGWRYDDFRSEPFSYRTLAAAFDQPLGNNTLPGSAPALADIQVAGLQKNFPFGAFAWHRRRQAPSGSNVSPFALIQGESLSGLTSTADANALGGNYGKVTTNPPATVVIAFDPAAPALDEFAQSVTIEVFARLVIPSAVTSASIQAYLLGPSSSSLGAPGSVAPLERPTGAALTVSRPTSGTAYPVHRLGTFEIPMPDNRSSNWQLVLVLNPLPNGAGGGIDYVMMLPARQRACTPTGKAWLASYPWVSGTPLSAPAAGSEQRTFRSNLSGQFEDTILRTTPGRQPPVTATGLGGAQIELPVGSTARLQGMVDPYIPDDPTSPVPTSGVAFPSPTVPTGFDIHAAVTPRYRLMRSV